MTTEASGLSITAATACVIMTHVMIMAASHCSFTLTFTDEWMNEEMVQLHVSGNIQGVRG